MSNCQACGIETMADLRDEWASNSSFEPDPGASTLECYAANDAFAKVVRAKVQVKRVPLGSTVHFYLNCTPNEDNPVQIGNTFSKFGISEFDSRFRRFTSDTGEGDVKSTEFAGNLQSLDEIPNCEVHSYWNNVKAYAIIQPNFAAMAAALA